MRHAATTRLGPAWTLCPNRVRTRCNARSARYRRHPQSPPPGIQTLERRNTILDRGPDISGSMRSCSFSARSLGRWHLPSLELLGRKLDSKTNLSLGTMTPSRLRPQDTDSTLNNLSEHLEPI
eukprot:5267433-Amphidinium_carterae.2